MPQEISIGLEFAPGVSPGFELGLEEFVSEVHPVSKLAVKLTASRIALTNLILLLNRTYPLLLDWFWIRRFPHPA